MDKKNYKETLGNIEAFVFDVDGVMTDGSVTIFPTGEFVRTMNVKDGYAMQLAVKRGFKIFVITGARAQSVSYNTDMAELPGFLQRHFARNNLMVIYPEQFGEAPVLTSFTDPLSADIAQAPSALSLKLRAFWRAFRRAMRRFVRPSN